MTNWTKRANYSVTEDLPGKPLVIRDEGPWNVFATITNDAERVVRDLQQRRQLPEGRRLLYWDSDGRLDEIIVRDGAFAGFRCLQPAHLRDEEDRK